MVANAPAAFDLTIAGFSNADAILNGNWKISFRHSIEGYLIWENEGHGDKLPQVSLRCESPVAVNWLLTLRHGNHVRHDYSCPAADWKLLGENVVRFSGVKPVKSIPLQITLKPA